MKHFLLSAFTILFSVSLCAKVSIISHSETEMVIEFTTDPWKISTEGEYSRLTAENMSYSDIPGAPSVPYSEFKVGIPPAGRISCTVLSSNSITTGLDSKLIPVPEIKTINGIDNYLYQISPAAYQPQRMELITQLPATNFRGYHFVPITLHPFVYDGNKTLTITTKATLKINISGATDFRSLEPGDKAADLLLAQLINSQQAKNWRSNVRTEINYAPFNLSDWWFRIETNRDGIYRIKPADISSLPLADIDPASFRLFSTSGKVLSNNINNTGAEFKEVPIFISGAADHSFDSQDYILFYGSSRDSYEQNVNVQSDPLYYNPYSQNQVFWLTFGENFSGTPLRIQTVPTPDNYDVSVTSAPASKQVENEIYRRESYGFSWYSETLFGNSTAEYVFTTNLTNVDLNGDKELYLRLRQDDQGEGTHHKIRLWINGTPVYNNKDAETDEEKYNFAWTGASYYNINRPVSYLVNGTNTLRIKVFRSTPDNLLLDYYRYTYQENLIKGNAQRQFCHPDSLFPNLCKFNFSGDISNALIFQITDLYNVNLIPVVDNYSIARGNYKNFYFILKPEEAYSPALIQSVQPNDLTAVRNQTDNIIVTPAEFLQQAQELAAKYWDIYQIRSQVILVDDIYNQFSGGHIDPAAIRMAMKYFYFNLPSPRITSLTLIGIGTIDWRNFSGSAAPKNKLIIWQGSYITSDDYFGMINTSYYPELAIGRYPVRNTNELNIMLQNFTSYINNPTPGWWRNSVLIVADDLTNGDSNYEYDLTQYAEQTSTVIHPSILVDKIFAIEYEYDEFQNKPKARDDLFKALNDGCLVMHYTGHGSYDKLGAEDYMNGATDMGRFNNEGKLTFFIAAACEVSQFDYWGFDCLSQKVVLLNNLGAIASLSATRKSFADLSLVMLKYVMDSLINNRNPLGYSVMDGKLRFTTGGTNDEMYILFGDPVIRVIPPERDSSMQVSSITDNGIVHSRETVAIEGSFTTEGLSGETEIKVFDSKRRYSLGPGTNVTKMGNQLFRGKSSVSASQYSSSFIVPDDVNSGADGFIVSYIWDENNKKDYTNFYSPLQLSDEAGDVTNTDIPQINIYLGSKDFRPGDTVGTNTSVYADFYDSNGINITGSSGHNILLVIDNSLQPVSITDYFEYDKNSCTSGSLIYPLQDLSEGMHTVQVVAFDNFNMPAVATTSFMAKKSSVLDIERLLIYPNPIAKDGYITFMLSDVADVNIGIYTLRGKRIANLKSFGRQGFNKVYFNGRDDKGDALANNTYFVKVQARSSSGRKVEKTEKMVIFK
ncbi:MAG TPA: type IX secretion system sortase PorU [Candidatus Cloacimonas sp.]|nr:type IX secretion system sortase PorU [Candidatus Cloacimonas sp.]HPS60820.1 type IX secretion system sortase PorU [Candidatus Cloacimonas sp.]